MSSGPIRALLFLPLVGAGAAVALSLGDPTPVTVPEPDSQPVVRKQSDATGPKLAPSTTPRKDKLVKGKPKARAPQVPAGLLAAFAETQALAKAQKPDEALARIEPWLKKHPDWFREPSRSKFIAGLRIRVEEVREAVDAEFEDWVDVASRWGSLRENEDATAFERRVRASAEIAARFPEGKERDAVMRHVRRFAIGRPSGRTPLRGRLDVDALLDRVASQPTPDDVEPLPVGDSELTEKRRLEELDRLRNAGALDLLDTVAGSLAWLALYQAPDGRISDSAAIEVIQARAAEDEDASDDVKGLKRGKRYELATTALATLAFLDFRDQDLRGLFEPTLARSIAWLRKQQRPDGSFPKPGRSYYGEAMALMALGQAAAATQQPELKAAVAKGLAWLNQHHGPEGGYRYRSKAAGDLSVTAWVCQAVETALWAGVELPDGMRESLSRFTKAAWIKDDRFTYMTKRRYPRWSLAGAGMLSATILFPEEIRDPTKEVWKKELIRRWPRQTRQLYWRYYSMRMISKLYGGVPKEIAKQLLAHARQQNTGGNLAGSFTPGSGWINASGLTCATAMTTLMFEHALYVR